MDAISRYIECCNNRKVANENCWRIGKSLCFAKENYKIDHEVSMEKKLIVVDDKASLNEFVKFAFTLYEGNQAWVPPLISDYKKYVSGIDNNLNIVGPNIKYLVKQGDQVVGRILVGIDQHLNEYKGLKDGYLSQFECIDDYEVAAFMLDAAFDWLKSHGMDRVKGPISLPAGEDNRGFIIDNFDSPTMIMNTYNMPYYNDFFVKYGFEKYHDCYAFETKINNVHTERYERLVPVAMKRYKFRLDTFDKTQVQREAKDIKTILDKALPEEWEDFMPLTDDDVDKVVKQLITYVDPNLLFIARNHKDEPIGFNITLPDYNQVLSKMKGRLLPFGVFKFLWNKKKIDRLRTFVLFVIPEYRQKGVSSAIYLQTYLNAMKAGYKLIEGSTIWDYNMPMLKDIMKLGIKKNITYRIYQKTIQ